MKKFSFTLMWALVGLWLAAVPVQAWAQEIKRFDNLSDAQVEDIETLIRDYLIANPEVLIEALTVYEARQEQLEAEARVAAMTHSQDALFHDTDSPVIGNPDGDVTIVEFFDYRCGYCKVTAERLQEVMAQDPNLRVVMKEFPILSPESEVAARAALAAERQGKYSEFHFALMNLQGSLSDGQLRQVARSVGMDVDQMVDDMQDPDLAAMIRKNHALARQLQIGGTPALVIGDELIPGAISTQAMIQKIAEQRAKGS